MRLTAREHAERLIENYTSHGLGDPRQSDDHAVAVAVALLDREKSFCLLPELTDDERKTMDAIDMTPILGTPAERLKLAMETAVKYMRKHAELRAAAKGLEPFLESGLATSATDDDWYKAATRLLRAIGVGG